MSKHIISVLVENHAGVLSKVSGLFSKRGFNIESLAVGVTEQENISRITIMADGDLNDIDQIKKQLGKLVDVLVVQVLDDDAISRELVIVKVEASIEQRTEIIQITELFKAKIIDITPTSVTIEITGEPEKIQAFTKMLSNFNVSELVRTGIIALERGEMKIKRHIEK